MKKRINIIQIAVVSMVVNTAYATVNLFIGFSQPSWWFISIGIYYFILCFMRSSVIIIRNKIPKLFVGIMLIITSVPLLGVAVISAFRDVGTEFHEIIMIAMALYAFTKVTLAIINLVKVNKKSAPTEMALRNISFADALVSIASLQRSMLVSFGEMAVSEIKLFNILTGSGVCILVFLSGLNLIISKKRKC